MRRFGFVLAVGLLGAGAVGCESTQQRLQRSIRQAFEQDPNAGNVLCGYPVLGLTNIAVTGVTNAGSSSSGTGTAAVTATPQQIPGMTNPPGNCSGTVAFAYDTQTTSSRNLRGRRTSSSVFRVFNITLTNRTGGGTATANMGAGMPGVPAMPGMPNMGSTAPSGRTALAPGAQTPTSVGMIVSGQLAPGDTPLSNGGMADDYSIQLTAGMPVTIVVRGGPSMSSPGSNLDVYTILMQNGVEVMHDDDSAGNLNSRILFTPPTTGMYTIRVTTFGGGMNTGMYTLQTWPGMNPMAQ